MSDLASRLRIEFMTRGVLGGRELRESLGVSQPTLSRALASLGDSLVRSGRTRGSRYALAAPVRDLGHAWPLYQIDRMGTPRELGTLRSLAGGSWWLEPTAGPIWPSLTGADFMEGIYPGLPWFLDDLRPQGFLGRAFARSHGLSLGEGNDPKLWSEHGVAASLIRHGGDLPGAFIIGREALAAALRERSRPIPPDQRHFHFPRLAEEALGGDVPESSAGGEQPKFSAVISDENGRNRHVLVKFSPEISSPEGRRWADLLVAESIAARVLGHHGFPVPRVDILDAGGRRFLEVSRFDRTESGGRLPCVSLRAHDAAFFGSPETTWNDAGERMVEAGWMTKEEGGRLTTLWRFGRMTANTDMHYGNVSLMLAEAPPLSLTPCYDMLPMAYRPGHENRIPDASEAMIRLTREGFGDEVVCGMALMFWNEVATSYLVSDEFRRIASLHATVR